MITKEKKELQEITLIGLALPSKTTNENGQSSIDCGNLWQKFEQGEYASKIHGKKSADIFAVYHDYEGDHTRPFSYFIGCEVNNDTEPPEGMDSLTIPKGIYRRVIAKGKMPDCIAETWREIWKSELPRAYRPDFEVYSERSQDWSDAEVDIYISVGE
ncbi:GyrI-like domain-containing protein [Aliifodinibius sp. S!AR15-10]|uniref:GyrI-like domain-containing protein n=1 Tax=Aliifodinibius sp. S!AR15-10 TaxID=2950437 RepID=UPI00285AFD3C|nr:GyrI-like domain-containing protein [Aliifodinibius sp. S!AR15-10]MDR8389737.1 GyrI-like domain-containing protein [Aliifodinibius sp. S!AR15-10]